MAKMTMKSQVLNFVESQGSARYTDIIRFIVDRKFGEGTYDNTYDRDSNGVQFLPQLKSYRGYYASAMTRGGMYHPQGYFLTGPNRLAKGADGLYRVERQA